MSDIGLRAQRFQPEDLAGTHELWHDQLRIALAELPTAWATALWSPDDPECTTP